MTPKLTDPIALDRVAALITPALRRLSDRTKKDAPSLTGTPQEVDDVHGITTTSQS